MLTLSKNEFSDELRVIEKVPTFLEYRKQVYPEDYYLIAESNTNIYECIDSMDILRRIEFEIKIENKYKNSPLIPNTDYIRNKISKKSKLKLTFDVINKKLYNIKKSFYNLICFNDYNDLTIDSNNLDINSSNELLAIIPNQNICIIYNIYRNGNQIL